MEIRTKDTKKLGVSDYVFEIDGNDVESCYVSYELGTYESCEFKNQEVHKLPVIMIEIKGLLNNEEVYLSFELKLDIKELNKLTNEPNDMSKYLFEGETLLKKPGENVEIDPAWYYSNNTILDMYRNLSYFNIAKLEENKFIFKMVIPNELFTFFVIDFNN